MSSVSSFTLTIVFVWLEAVGGRVCVYCAGRGSVVGEGSLIYLLLCVPYFVGRGGVLYGSVCGRVGGCMGVCGGGWVCEWVGV